jgi:hypothetical protein
MSAATWRYNARIRSVTADPGPRELHKQLINDLADQCEDKKPLREGLRSLTARERKYACKAITEFRDTLEFENLLDRVIDLFIIITGKPYNGEHVEHMILEIQKVKLFLYEQAQLFGLFGEMKQIHTSVVLDELKDIDDEAILNYCILMFIETPREYDEIYDYSAEEPLILTPEQKEELRVYALFGKLAHLERLRIDLYIYDVLFGDVNSRVSRYPGAVTFYDVPLADQIITRGVSYYYPRVGAISNEELYSRYHPYELLCVLAQLDRGRMLAECGWNVFDLTSRIITTLYKRGWDDPRTVITPFGPRNIVHSPDYLQQLSLNEDLVHTYEDLRDCCMKEGIRIEGWHGRPRAMRDLMHDYIVAQLGEDFFTRVPAYRDIREVSLGIYTSIDTMVDHGEPRTDVLWYGGRNGTSAFRGMTYKCLADVWTSTRKFTCPFNTTATFPIRTIRRLMYVLSMEGDHPEAQLLMQVISDQLWSSTRRFGIPIQEQEYIADIFDRQRVLVEELRSGKYSRNRLITKIQQIYNLGLFFSTWNDDGPISLVKDEDIEDSQGRRRNNALSALSSIMYSLQDVPELLKLRIVRLLAEKPTVDVAEAKWLDQRAPYPAYEIEMNASTIGEYLMLLVSAHRFGIDTMLKHSSVVLQLTAEKYARDVVDISFFSSSVLDIISPELRVVDLGINYDWQLGPKLLDLVKGTSVDADVSDGKWQELPLLTA